MNPLFSDRDTEKQKPIFTKKVVLLFFLKAMRTNKSKIFGVFGGFQNSALRCIPAWSSGQEALEAVVTLEGRSAVEYLEHPGTLK